MPGSVHNIDSYLEVRLSALRRMQNPDGGWGYFPGKSSWLEPTAYAAMALDGEPAADRAWKLLESWQLPDGSWKPSAHVNVSNWGTSLCVSMAVARQQWDQPALRKGVEWLVGMAGVETNWLSILVARVGLVETDRDIGLKAWPWNPGNSSWLEPTVHAVVALKQASIKMTTPELKDRVRIGEEQLLNVRGKDGGWNYGSPMALGIELPSYPETTALALVGLQGNSSLGKAFDVAARMISDTPSPLARAWLTIALRLHGVAAPELTGAPSEDVMITAIEALAAPEGRWALMKTGNTGGKRG